MSTYLFLRADRGRRLRFAIFGLVAIGLTAFAPTSRATITYTDLYTISTPAGYGAPQPGVVDGQGNNVQVAAGGQVIGAAPATSSRQNHAFVWSPSATSGIDLQPSTGLDSSEAYGTNGSQHVGVGTGTATGDAQHALLWNGTSSDYVDLHPSRGVNPFLNSFAVGTDGVHQVGYGTDSTHNYRALLWNGSADTYVDLGSLNYQETLATAVSGDRQVGYGENLIGSAFVAHAVTWLSTAVSIVDLNPAGFDTSTAYGVASHQEVGTGRGSITGNNFHALLWTDTADSYVDLSATLFSQYGYSEADATDGVHQVGYGDSGSNDHALLWSGTPDSWVDLGALLPANIPYSRADSVNGNHVFGYGIDTGGVYHALEWNLDSVPEPTGLLPLSATISFLLRRRHGNRTH